jgi:exosortase E/protease (VPEID-CTERM system)
MTTALETNHTPRAEPAPLPESAREASRGVTSTGRLAALAGVLVIEVLAVSLRHWWVELLGDFRDLSAVAITLAVAMGVFAAERFQRLGRFVAAHAHPALPWGRLLLQLGAYAGFLLFTRYIVTCGLHTSASGGLWVAAWALAGFGVIALWGLVVMPARGWRELARRAWPDAVLAALVVSVAWGASRYSRHLWRDLADDTLRAVEVVLRLFFTDVTVVPETHEIGAGAFVVTVAPECSGYEGFGLVAAVIGSYLWLCRHTLRFPAALLLLPLALGASWLMNVGRIAALIAIGACGWPVVAVNGFHTQAGWLAFNAIALGVVLVSRSSSVFVRRTDEDAARPVHGPNLAAPLLVPLLVLVAAAMITGAASAGGVDRLYAVRVGAASLVLWAYRHSYAGLGWSWSWVAFGVGVATFGLWIGFEMLLPPDSESAASPFELPAAERWMWLMGRVLGAVVLVPIAEELAFRGYLLRRLQGLELDESVAGRWNWFAVLVSSVLFGLLHPGRWVAGALTGVLFAWAFYRRGRLSDAILAHATTNAVLAGYVLATGQWALW